MRKQKLHPEVFRTHNELSNLEVPGEQSVTCCDARRLCYETTEQPSVYCSVAISSVVNIMESDLVSRFAPASPY